MLRQMKKLAHPLTAALAAIIIGYGSVALAQPTGPITLQPDEVRPVEGNLGCPVSYTSQDASHGTLSCGPPPEVIEGVAVCTDHVSTAWHSLVKRDAAGAITCTYGHEHHADPTTVNDIFGAPSAWYGGAQSISYPWQTSGPLGLENHAKHEGYKWYVVRDIVCTPFSGQPGCVRAFRVQVHSLGTASDTTARFHSFGLEAVVEHNGVSGIVRHGGWIDTGHLSLLFNGSAQRACPPLTSNPATFTCGTSPKREHSGTNHPTLASHTQGLAHWYSQHQVSQITPRVYEWGPTDFQNPSNQLLYPASQRANNTKGRVENMAVVLTYPWLTPYRDANGRVTFNGHTDSKGAAVTGCTTLTPDCVPLKIEAAPGVITYFNAVANGLANDGNFDVSSPATGNSLVRFPN